MLIKICGITDPEMARFAAEKGAQYIGILFSKVSPRAVPLQMAKEIAAAARAAGAEPVGVFADESTEEILRISRELDLNIVQLHGDLPRKAAPHLPMQKIYVADGKPLPECLDATRDFLLFEKIPVDAQGFCFFIAGGLTPLNVQLRILSDRPDGVDVSSGVEIEKGKKDPQKIEAFLRAARPSYFGAFGGMFVPELLAQPLLELAEAFEKIAKSEAFEEEFLALLQHYVGRPTALTEIPRFAEAIGAPRIFLKREDLAHTGAHKINHALGQCLLAKKMGKMRIIAETGAGMHGVATATAAALLGLECVIYMGQIDMDRQAPNVAKMHLLGAQVIATKGTLKDAVNEALRSWATNYETTHYCLGSALGPHPFPTMVAHFQRVIGREAKQQLLERVGRDPDYVIACVGGGSNAIGLFSAYLQHPQVRLIGVEAGGRGKGLGRHAARFLEGSLGILHGTKTLVLQDQQGQIAATHSISAGLDYPAVGPQHAAMHRSGKAQYEVCTDAEALAAFELLARTEGIIPALESAHALGYLMRIAQELPKESIVLINLSGRGDKDLPKLFEKELAHVAHR